MAGCGEREAFLRRFVVLSDQQACAVVLWAAMTHAVAAFVVVAYLSISSPEKRSGKTRLLEVLDLLASRPWLTGGTTKAALVRKMDRDHPTLLLDESDAAFNGDKEYGEAPGGAQQRLLQGQALLHLRRQHPQREGLRCLRAEGDRWHRQAA